ncbi:hypothetical protein B5G50_17620 [Brevibacillus brevis]|uniref:M48 family metallopeptidase n=1 Tax=Brevibacillus brevis TaxID=1393 RepID=UPI000B3AA7B5|nr:M48 family metallopeptidase [Brevibacillus brevis]OUQ87041.1 hypothetical protein B5G50_17620 [Brevibacillus brevis]
MKPCPSCGAQIEANEGYPFWCEHCDWNLAVPLKERQGNAWERLERKMRDTYGQALFKELQGRTELVTKQGVSERVASAYSLVVIGCSVASFLFSLYGLFAWYRSPFIFIICLLILLFAWLSRPRPHPFPKMAILLNADEHPTTMKIFEIVAQKMGVRKGIQFALSPYYEAYTTEYGWRRARVVVIGYPLLFACTSGELTALLAHELAHCRNNDIRRSALVSHAQRILLNWCDLLDPIKDDDDEYHFSFIATLSRGIMRLLLWIPYHLLAVLIHLYWNQSQRAEYEADRMAAQLAGSQHLISLLQIIHMNDVVEPLIARHSLQKQSMTLGQHLHEAFSKLPGKEKMRIVRILERSQQSMDTTHPATHMRIAMLLHKDAALPAYQISDWEYNQICQEMTDQLQEKMEHQIIDDYRAKLA